MIITGSLPRQSRGLVEWGVAIKNGHTLEGRVRNTLKRELRKVDIMDVAGGFLFWVVLAVLGGVYANGEATVRLGGVGCGVWRDRDRGGGWAGIVSEADEGVADAVECGVAGGVGGCGFFAGGY